MQTALPRQNSRALRETTLPSVDGEHAPAELPSSAKPFLWVAQASDSDPAVAAIAASNAIWQQPDPTLESCLQLAADAESAGSSFRLLLQQVEMEHDREIGLLRAELQSQLEDLRQRVHQGCEVDENHESGSCEHQEDGVRPSSSAHAPRDEHGAEVAQNIHGSEDSGRGPVNGTISEGNEELEKATAERTARLDNYRQSRSGMTKAFVMESIERLGRPKKIGKLSSAINHLVTRSREEPDETPERHRCVEAVHNIVESSLFDGVCASAIILNAILLGVATDFVARREKPDGLPRFFTYADRTFSAWFFSELCLRMIACGPCKFFFGTDWSWNLFDFFVVLSDCVETSVAFFSGEVTTLQNLTAIRMLRVLRLARALRVIRLVRFFKELRMMVYSVLRSGLSLLWSMILLSLVIFIFSVYLTQNVTFHLYYDADESSEVTEKLRTYFGSLIFAMYMLFQCISSGISWGEVGRPLLEIHWTNGLVLVWFVFFTVFAVLNIITGIFVDAALKSAETDRDEVIQEAIHSENSALFQMQRFFLQADTDKSGTITLEELEDQLQNQRVRAHLQTLGVEVNDAKTIFRLLDLDRSGEISIEEFIFGCMKLKGTAKSVDLLTLIHENRRMKDHLGSFFLFVRDKFQEMQSFQDKLEFLLQPNSPRGRRFRDSVTSKEFSSGETRLSSGSTGEKTPPVTGDKTPPMTGSL